MTSVFSLLRAIRERPEQYLLGDDTDRAGQLERLQMLLLGYGHAVRLHGRDDPGLDFVRSFGDYLRERMGWSTPLGPVATILLEIQPSEKAWERFWELIDDYERHVLPES